MFHAKVKVIPGDRVEELVGHAPGAGSCSGPKARITTPAACTAR